MVGFFSSINNEKTLLFATREFLILLLSWTSSIGDFSIKDKYIPGPRKQVQFVPNPVNGGSASAKSTPPEKCQQTFANHNMFLFLLCNGNLQYPTFWISSRYSPTFNLGSELYTKVYWNILRQTKFFFIFSSDCVTRSIQDITRITGRNIFMVGEQKVMYQRNLLTTLNAVRLSFNLRSEDDN